MSSILPVIDLKSGAVVRGVAGERERYRPVESILTPQSTPAAVAYAFRQSCDFRDVYIADLDAIAGAPPAWCDYEAIAAAGLQLWIDAGAGDLPRARELADAQPGGKPIDRIVIALESLANRDALAQIASEIDPARLVFSLDLKDGRPLAVADDWRTASPLQIAADVVPLGIRRMIVLDLVRVGVGQGTGTEDLCREINRRWPEIELIGGGGVNSLTDVARLYESGLSRVLVASALHDGRIS